MPFQPSRILTLVAAVAAAGLLAFYGWQRMQTNESTAGFISGNGRIEATEIDIAARQGGRLLEVLVGEGDFVQAGQVLARMQVDTLNAQRDEARAQHAQALTAVATAQAQVKAEIIKHLFAHLPAGAFASDEINLKAGAVFAHLYTTGLQGDTRVYH